MKIVFYNTSSSVMENRKLSLLYPQRAELWDGLAAQYPEHEICFVATKGGDILMDADNGGELPRPKNVQYVLTEATDSADQIVDIIAAQKPDVVMGISTGNYPIDWNFIKDAVIAEKLRAKGIRTIAHPVSTAMAFYDKWRSSMALRYYGFKVAKSIFVHNDQFWAEQVVGNIKCNIYKEYILYRVSQFNYPVIIKETVSAGSIGIQTADTFEEAAAILTSENNKSDVIVEELIKGEDFSAEVYGADGVYHVSYPIRLYMGDSTPFTGASDSFQRVKFGPVTSEKYHVKELRETLLKMAKDYQFGGGANLDLMFKDGEWYVIEVNPRFSGLTNTVAVTMDNRNPLITYAEGIFGGPKEDLSDPAKLKYVLNFEICKVDEETYKKIGERESVKHMFLSVSQYGEKLSEHFEVVIGGFDTGEELLAELKSIAEDFPGLVSENTIKNTAYLVEQCK